MRGQHEHERPDGAGPLRGHAVARQVARDQVQQPGHRGGAGEPEDRDRRDVVHRAEGVAEVLVREEGERATVGLAAGLERGGRDQQRGDETSW